MLSELERAEVRTWLEERDESYRAGRPLMDPPVDLLARAALEDPSAYVRWNALQTLDHHGDARHADVFLRACADPVPRVRRHALHALSCDRCKTEPLCVDPVPTLRALALADLSPQVRVAAVQALRVRAYDERARAVLADVLRTESHPRVRRWVTWRSRPPVRSGG
jgi:HEAT repeat protein